MEARLKNPVMLIPGALQALLALDKSTETAEVPYVTRKLIHLRASQINAFNRLNAPTRQPVGAWG